ncbi:MAG: hypothetical protein RIR34_760 [Actinomycetota bacterium]
MTRANVTLSSEFASDLLGLPGRTPLLSWAIDGAAQGESQLAAEVQSSADADFATILDTLKIEGAASQFVKAPGSDLASREVRHYRVRIQTEKGWSAFSNSYVQEAGLLNGSDFVGQAIGDVSEATSAPALLRTEFAVGKQVAKARLYATAHGTFDLMLNGQRVGDEVLAPGWTPYGQRLLSVTHDVTSLLQDGANAWGVLLADGWYRGKFGFTNETANYGSQTSFLGQLEIEYTDGTSQTVVTDDSWMVGQGGVRFASIYDGTDFDFNFVQEAWCKPGFAVAENTSGEWKKATAHSFDKQVLEPRIAPPVRVIEEFPAALSTHNGNTRVDLTQNISGWLRIKVKAQAGSKLIARHAEVVEPSGNLHTKALRFARATDSWVFAKDGEYVLEPKQTFHGFQYADLIAENGTVDILEVTGMAISTDLPARSHIETAHPLINKLVSNTYWSLRDNFVSIPTDCPQRDERLGWTGDAQAFVYAANTLVSGDEFFRTWLRDLDIEQSRLDGKVPVIVPDIISHNPNLSDFFKAKYGEAGWSDAATVIPWSLFEAFGDEQILRDQLDSMRAWVAHNEADHDGLLIGERMQLGDWLDPDAAPGQPWNAKVSGRFMANAYMARSVWILAKAEKQLGNASEAAALETRFETLKSAIWAELGEAAAKTPTGAATLLEFDLAPSDKRAEIADNLAAGVRDTDGLIVTGFLGTPIILDAMSRNGQLDAAFTMLLREEIRSWLYPIKMGATTIWERWDGIAEDGSISGGELASAAEGSEGSMISFNHYAYGAVVDWIYRNVGGIAPQAPAYEQILIAPRPHEKITSSDTSIDTGYGRISLNWEIRDSNLVGELTVPFGVTASFDLLGSANSALIVNSRSVEKGQTFGHGRYTFLLNNPLIAH